MSADAAPTEIVVCSLEPWDEVWRRNQLFVDALLRRLPQLRVLFVEPPADGTRDLVHHGGVTGARVRSLRDDGRLHALRPVKLLPRRFGAVADRLLRTQVLRAVEQLQFRHPTLWLNDVTYAPLIRLTGWPTVYDVTDDWLLAPFDDREIRRLAALDAVALAAAQEVVVCSAALAASRGSRREVTVVPNGVDGEHFRRPRARPGDLPAAPAAVYVGTLHDARLDIELVGDLAASIPHLSVVLVGPNALKEESLRQLGAHRNIHLLGPRAYDVVPAYFQHADVVIVPHRVTPFTESLDPIKAYECLAVPTPVVATPVAGFRDLGAHVDVADRASFVQAVVRAVFSGQRSHLSRTVVPSWDTRSASFESILARARRDRARAEVSAR